MFGQDVLDVRTEVGDRAKAVCSAFEAKPVYTIIYRATSGGSGEEGGWT